MTTTISDVRARRVWDSRARPTVEVEVWCGNRSGRAIAPAGASTGSGEAVERRDGGDRLGGRDVSEAVANVHDLIGPALFGLDANDQRAIDAALERLDPLPTLATLGANAVVATSLAVAHAAAAANGRAVWQQLAHGLLDTAGSLTIPLPEIQIFGGGAHAGRRIDIQDLMVMAPGAGSFTEALEWTAEIYAAAAATFAEPSGVADEGGWWPAFDHNEAAIEALVVAIERAGLSPGRDVVLSLDVAASEFWRDGSYHLGLDGRVLTSDEQVELVARWCRDYPIASVEDPCGEHDLEGLRAFCDLVGDRVQVVGDDVYVTNAAVVRDRPDVANAVLIKVNQAGTVSRTLDAFQAASDLGLGAIVSARSGESEDVSIVHLAVGWGAQQLKVGSIARGERTAKWNEMLRIEERLGTQAHYAGWSPLPSRP